MTTDFESQMNQGIQAHADGDYLSALSHRLNAFAAIPPHPYDRGRAARDIAATFDRLGNQKLKDSSKATNQEMAGAYAEYAYREHKKLSEIHNLESTREFTVSAMYMAISAARQNDGINALKFIREGWRASKNLEDALGYPHQYDVNMSGRVLGIEGLYGPKDREHLRYLGEVTMQLANISQTSEIFGADTSLSLTEVKEQQHKAKIRSNAARAIVELQLLPTSKLTKALSNQLLKRVVL